MSEQYYIVSEKELEELMDESIAFGLAHTGAAVDMRKAYQACVTRPVVRDLDQETLVPHYVWVEVKKEEV